MREVMAVVWGVVLMVVWALLVAVVVRMACRASAPRRGARPVRPDRRAEWEEIHRQRRALEDEYARLESQRRGRNRAASLGRRGDPNDLAPWDRL